MKYVEVATSTAPRIKEVLEAIEARSSAEGAEAARAGAMLLINVLSTKNTLERIPQAAPVARVIARALEDATMDVLDILEKYCEVTPENIELIQRAFQADAEDAIAAKLRGG